MVSAITIRTGTSAEVVALSQQIPEFDNPHGATEYEKRLNNVPNLILIAFDGEKPVGFKVGYEKERDGSFYSWMGGVLPEYRRYGIAKRLADTQETWTKEKGYQAIRFKTRNRHTAMLQFALNNGFYLIAVEPREKLAEYRIVLEKRF